jgi:hypothetical protein
MIDFEAFHIHQEGFSVLVPSSSSPLSCEYGARQGSLLIRLIIGISAFLFAHVNIPIRVNAPQYQREYLPLVLLQGLV